MFYKSILDSSETLYKYQHEYADSYYMFFFFYHIMIIYNRWILNLWSYHYKCYILTLRLLDKTSYKDLLRFLI